MKSLYQAQRNEDGESDLEKKFRLRYQRQNLDKELFAAQRQIAEETKVGHLATSS